MGPDSRLVEILLPWGRTLCVFFFSSCLEVCLVTGKTQKNIDYLEGTDMLECQLNNVMLNRRALG